MSHTEGPWRLEAFDEESGNARIAQRVRGPGPDDWGRSIWMYTGSEADARLIRAAPDLLAAIEAFLEADRDREFADTVDLDEYAMQWANALNGLKAAAAKARGAS